MRELAICLVLVGTACSSNDHAGPDAPVADAPAPDAPSRSLGALMPRLVTSNPTAILATPKVTAITYDNDTNRSSIEAFFGALAASSVFAAQAAEYGVGALAVGTPRHLAGNAPATITDAAITQILTANLTGSTPAWGSPDPDTVYSFFFPSGTILDDGSGSLCCTDYDGYHYDVSVGGVDVAYAIQCTCPGFDGTGITDLQQLTVVADHELVEAVTDPHPATTVGYGDTDDAHVVWSYITGGENADLCAFADTAYLLTPASLGYAIQRSWSNVAVMAGHDPCVPEATLPYYQAVPDQSDTITVSPSGGPIASKGTKVARNTPGSITLHVLADDPSAGPFTITVEDVNSSFFGRSPLLTFTQPTGTYHLGDTLTVPVTVSASDPGLGAAEAYYVKTAPASGPATYFYALVGQ